MSHPSWTISWDVLSTSIASTRAGRWSGWARSLAHSLARPAAYDLNGATWASWKTRARKSPPTTRTTTTTRSSSICLFLAPTFGATRRDGEATTIPHVRTPSTTGSLHLACARMRKRRDTEQPATGHCGLLEARVTRRGAQRRARERRRDGTLSVSPALSRRPFTTTRTRGHACQGSRE